MNPVAVQKKKELNFERTYPAPMATVWQAWTQPSMLQQWWRPENTTVPECEIDLRVGGTIRTVIEAGAGIAFVSTCCSRPSMWSASSSPGAAP